jgi:hypothetical protein
MNRILPLVLLAACAHAPEWPEDPSGSDLVTDDVARFWSAVDAPGELAGNVDALYLDAASDGLDGLRRKRFRSAGPLAEAYERNREWYDATRPVSLGLAGDEVLRERVFAAMEAAEAEYPDAVHPPVTVAVGVFDTGATVLREGIVVGAEFVTAAEGAPIEGLDAWRRAAVRPPEDLPLFVAQSHAAAQEIQACEVPRATLLEQALLEGGAAWLAERWGGGHLHEDVHAWALPREAELWSAFQEDMGARSYDGWLYEGLRDDGQPADAGAFVGYRIVAAWWADHGDEADAIARVVAARCDAEGFLAESGYDPR